MRIAIVGTGYVGLVTGACFAEMGHAVTCIDKDEKKIEGLGRLELPIYEPGLSDLVSRNAGQDRLRFSTDIEDAARADFAFIGVGTPPNEDGSADLSAVLAVAEQLGRLVQPPATLVIKSTVPVGTADKVREVFAGPVVSNPEFLKEGDAINDSMRPPRVVLGRRNEDAHLDDSLRRLYEPFTRGVGQILIMDNRSAELVKHTANAMLATRIHFMDEIADLCEACGADVDQVRVGIGSDPRIGPKFLFAGPGFSGSCFPKDLRALVQTSDEYDRHLYIATTVARQNELRRVTHLWRKCQDMIDAKLNTQPTLAIAGIAFKPGTDDIRESPAAPLCEQAIGAGWAVRATDPQADYPELYPSIYHAAEGADVLCLVTDWNQYKSPDWATLRDVMRGDAIVDGRNLWDPAEVHAAGFRYVGIGRGRTPRSGI